MAEERDWGVINDSGQWEVMNVSEERARQAYNSIHYGKLVKNIRSGNRYTVVVENTDPHTQTFEPSEPYSPEQPEESETPEQNQPFYRRMFSWFR